MDWRGEQNRMLEQALRETDPEIRTEKLRAEVMRLGVELEQTLTQLDQLRSRLAEQDMYLNMNADTGLPTYRVFFRELEQLIELSSRGEPQPFALVQIRMDSDYQRIKHSKDRSKALLFKTSIRIREVIGDTLYQSDRLDEFFILVRNFSSTDELHRMLFGTAREVAKPHEAIKEIISFGCQIAFALFPSHGANSQDLLTNTETALHYCINKKKNIVGYTPKLGEAFNRIAHIEQELHRATQYGFEHFHMVYQPFVDASHKIRGCESLIRWNHPELGFIPPPRFIPTAERTGDIRILGRWILYQSCRQLKAWHDLGYPDIFVSVNLSPVQFVDKDLVVQVAGVLEATGIAGHHLKLEITEGAIMSNPQDAIRKLQALRDLGIRISIDDFGTGYSSLNYLAKLPIDTLKIDKSFVDDVTVNVTNQEIVRAIISLATSLRIETLAEGVETANQKDLILAEGCKYIQGFFFSKPVDAARFAEYLGNGGILPVANG